MTAAPTAGRRTGSRTQRLLGYDGPVATMLLATFQYFIVSVSFVAALAPVLAFQALVGWQATHLAIWLGALSLVTLFPGLHGLLQAAEALREDGAAARAGRVFWHGFARAVRTLPWAAVGIVVIALLIGYDLALLGSSDLVFLIAMAAIGVTVIIAIAVSIVAGKGEQQRPLALATAAAAAVGKRPHAALAWLMLAGLAVAATTIPVVGAVAWFFAPAGAAVAIQICNRALGFDAKTAGR
ncbi:hypothetical protein JOD63_003069 [Microbacterium terrae]|uniref:DUF624 domain-containing protein n=1 Tax=Microbacterium terrae TaxID=69369 RepID=A0A0M2H8E3_9MICO|nr:hypothetical protein [Microbacterium terrae]KJL42671.1 hypothetical protein RS81_01174 [Microbacterium terrae]MBP1079101.1 hypothetical protein [Microbacterium terrae]GLJ98503.1 hypothetical protein GCM10017594_17000 [Microbacterium terrae]